MAGIIRDERGRPAELYRLYDESDRLLYIGVSSNVARRLRTHSFRVPTGKAWWTDVAYCTLQAFAEGWQALDAECLAIRAEDPIYNRRSVAV